MAGDETPGAAKARIPSAAAAIVDLLNSREHAIPAMPDTLDNPDTALEILSRFGQPAGEPLSPQRLDRIRALRSDLMTVVDPPSAAGAARAWTRITGHASTVFLQQDFAESGEVHLRHAQGDPVIAGITLNVAELVASNSWTRVRACANEVCKHVFYDTTRSRTQRWDSYEICGNRSNVAAYRARKNKPAAKD